MNPYAALPTADLCDLHNAVAWLKFLANKHQTKLPPSEWAMLDENLTWIADKIDTELEQRQLHPEQTR
jgi:hypothetical protein